MLLSGIPAYRLPREVLRNEIRSLLSHGHVTPEYGRALGRDFCLDDLFARGFRAVFLALGAHKSQRLNLPGEESQGIYPALDFLSRSNRLGEQIARGHVGVIGGGNAAVDAARLALRQAGVQTVTILYRRTRADMPAFIEEVEAALEEGIRLEPLVSPARILSDSGRVTGVVCVKNRLAAMDGTGRRSPVEIPGTEHTIPLDTLIVAVGEAVDGEILRSAGLAIGKDGRIAADPDTLATSRQGVFAGGDVVAGPNTVVEAIAAGKKAAVMIDRFLKGEDLRQPARIVLPGTFIPPASPREGEPPATCRVRPPRLPLTARRGSQQEIEMPFSCEEAEREARRCLRCDLEFTGPREEAAPAAMGAATP